MEKESIGVFIKNRRKELRLTQYDVAKACGVTGATVSRWESGDIANMRRSTIQALANVLRISPVTLINFGDDAPSTSVRQGTESEGAQTDSGHNVGSYVPRRTDPQDQFSPIDTYSDEILADLQRLHDDKETRMLLSATRNLSKEDILFMVELAKKMHKDE